LSRDTDSPLRVKSSCLMSSKRASSKLSTSPAPTIEEDSMGYIMHPDKQQYSCSSCPFVCKSLTDIEIHRQHHKSGPGRSVKCSICPFYVADKQELMQHLLLHGIQDMKIDSAGNLTTPIDQLNQVDEAEISSEPGKQYKCTSCPYVIDSMSQFIYHKQFHRPRGAPYKCPKCSYNVSRRQLLNQHLKVHGLPPVRGEGLLASLNNEQYGSDSDPGSEAEAEAEAAEAIEMNEEEMDHESAVQIESSSALGSDGYTHLGLDPNFVQKLPDSATMNMADIPLTWVSRGKKFYKMFKCRFCPHVNVRKANIQEHEKRHQTRSTDGSGKSTCDSMHACTLCNYCVNNAGVLSSHVKVHQYVLGIVHGLVDTSRTDEEQLRSLAGKMDHSESKESAPQPKLELLLSGDNKSLSGDSPKSLHFCAHCPARFLVEPELLIHQRFHGVKLPYRCDVCSYTARQENHLLAHWKVHSQEYQERTKVLVDQHLVSDKYPQPRILAVQTNKSVSDDEGAIDLTNRKATPPETTPPSEKHLSCSLCPAKFNKDSKAQQYHATLHGSNGPFRCRFCNYAVKAHDNLLKHEKLHKENASSTEKSSEKTTTGRQLPLPIGSDSTAPSESAENGNVSEGSSGKPSGSGSGGKRSKRYKCPKCPSAFEKKEQFKVHSNLHGSKQRYRCDRCDYAVKYYANYLQHMKKHDQYDTALANGNIAEFNVDDGSSETGEATPGLDVDGHLMEHSLSTAEKQQIWLEDKLRPPSNGEEEPFHCHYCPYRCNQKGELELHSRKHAVNGATGSYRCNFCDFTVLEQSQLYEHIQLHFQLKGRVKLESYWKCSNLEIWSEPVGGDAKMVFDEKVKQEIESDDEDALFIDLSTGQPIKDDADVTGSEIASLNAS